MIQSIDREDLRQTLLELPADKTPLWGLMSAQHMIEHLTEFVMISSGKIASQLVVSDEVLPQYREALLSPHGFMKNVGTTAQSMLNTLRHNHISAAVEHLFQEMEDFEAYFRDNPSARPVHLFFGALDEKEWRWFHYKHFSHHLAQFGLLPEW